MKSTTKENVYFYYIHAKPLTGPIITVCQFGEDTYINENASQNIACGT